MIEVGAYHAKTHFAQLLDKVKQGQHVVITRHRRPVARLVPAQAGRGKPLGHVIGQLRAFGAGRTLGRLSLRRMIEEGRR